MIFENCGSWPETRNFYEIRHLVQIEHANYEYSTSNWWSWTKIIDSRKFGRNTEICSDFYEIWHSQQIEHANYEYNTHMSKALAWLLAQNDNTFFISNWL